MHDLVVSDVDGGMISIVDDIARLHLIVRDRCTFVHLCIGRSGKGDPVVSIHRLYESGTVSPIHQIRAAPYIGVADKLQRVVRDFLAS